ncbi:hypothetical protein ElyMa_002058000 [Elysia marginata]|uniref:Uncharacterized protein n=1 Tax=Elysia marginata TaxID=1093978 RepID=A0AAV4FA95_9GAST|nr:hypothetical protein ElyMa_002058000 [Elysia marginata]
MKKRKSCTGTDMTKHAEEENERRRARIRRRKRREDTVSSSNNSHQEAEDAERSSEEDSVDEDYQALARTFLATGKGRRANLPSLTVTNKLILQLNHLRLQNNLPWKVQLMHNLQKLALDPSDFFDFRFQSVFANEMIIETSMSNSIHSFIQNNDKSIIERALRVMCEEAKLVVARQLADFLEGGAFSYPNPNTEEQLSHCPLTNLVGESAFGDIDYDFSKRRNCTLHNRSTVHMIKRNKTMSFVKCQTSIRRAKLFQTARKHAKLLRKKHKEEEEQVKIVAKEKMVANQEKKIQKDIAILERRNKITLSVKKHGGPCTSSIDVVNLLKTLKEQGRPKSYIVKAFQNEIRFQKALGSTRGLKLGTLAEMVSYLKTYFDAHV